MNKRAKVVELPKRYVQKLDPLRPAADQISASLKTAVLEMSLKPGQIISEAEVGNLYGASRTPVREAFTWLREQGLLVTYPSRGNYVSKLSIPQIKGAQFARESLEITVAEFLCEQGMPEETREELEANLRSQHGIVASGEGAAFHMLDDNFHLALVGAVGHSRISDIIQKEKSCLDRLRVLSLQSKNHLNQLVDDHVQIFDSIIAADKTVARKAVRKHLRRVLKTLDQLFKEHREYFDDD